MDRTEVFRQQIEAMYKRLGQLYDNVQQSPVVAAEQVPAAWKELGIAAEELQVANEELRQQNDEIAITLQDAAAQRYYYQRLVNHIPEAYLVTTSDGKIQEVNLLAAKLLQVEERYLTGKLLINFVALEQRLAFRTQLNHLLQENQVQVRDSHRDSHRDSQAHTWSIWIQPRDAAPLHLAITTTISYDLNGEVLLHWLLRPLSETWSTLTPLSHGSPLPNSPAQGSSSQNGSSANDSSTPSNADSAIDAMPNRPVEFFAKGEVIPLQPQILWQVEQGLVKLHTLTEENEEVLLGLVSQPMSFGAGSSFLGIYQAVALTDVYLFKFSLAEIKASPQLAQLLLPQFNQRGQQMESLLAIAGQRQVRHRLRLFLRLLQQEIGEPVENGTRLTLRFTHADLANACCTTRVTITRLLGELQKQGKLIIDPKYHIILCEKF